MSSNEKEPKDNLSESRRRRKKKKEEIKKDLNLFSVYSSALQAGGNIIKDIQNSDSSNQDNSNYEQSNPPKKKKSTKRVTKKIDKNGQIRYFLGNGEDVTEKVLQQKEKKKRKKTSTNSIENVEASKVIEGEEPKEIKEEENTIQTLPLISNVNSIENLGSKLDKVDQTKNYMPLSSSQEDLEEKNKSNTSQEELNTTDNNIVDQNNSLLGLTNISSISHHMEEKSNTEEEKGDNIEEEINENVIEEESEEEEKKEEKENEEEEENEDEESEEEEVAKVIEPPPIVNNNIEPNRIIQEMYSEKQRPFREISLSESISRFLRRSLTFVKTLTFTDPKDVPIVVAKRHELFDSSKNQSNLIDPILAMKIKGADMLKLDKNVIHPVVRVSVIDITTGQYLKIDKFTNKSIDFVVPQLTITFDMKTTKSLVPVWNDQLYFDVKYNHFLKENVVFIFELMDFSFEKGEYKIAWGFLRAVSTSGRANWENTDTDIRIKLFEFPKQLSFLSATNPQRFSANSLMSPPLNASAPQQVNPTVNQLNPTTTVIPNNPQLELFRLYQARSSAKLYPSTLYIQINPIERPPKRKVTFPERPIKPNEIEIGRFSVKELLHVNENGVKTNLQVISRDNPKKIDQSLKRKKMQRDSNEPCEIPTTLLYQLGSGERGCICLEFSNSGRYLACGCHNMDIGIVAIYDMYTGKIVEKLNGHMDIIYSVNWNFDDTELISASSDGTVILWSAVFDNRNAKSKLISTFQHHCFVYVAKFHPICGNVIVTGSYDKKVRIWHKETGKVIKELEGHSSRISCIAFDLTGTRMYTASGDGTIKVWSCRLKMDSTLEDINNSFACVRTINDGELAKSTLTCIRVDPRYPQERLLIHSQDNMIRRLDLGLKNIRNHYSGVKCFINSQKSNVSPDGQYLVSGSDSGRIYFWNIETEELIFKEGKDYCFEESPVYDIAWSKTEHLIALCSFEENQPIRVFCFEKQLLDNQLEEPEIIKRPEENPYLLYASNLQERESNISSSRPTTPFSPTAVRMLTANSQTRPKTPEFDKLRNSTFYFQNRQGNDN
ncbi:hypothetical protein ABK040_002088 [Willaertia magna]